MSALGKLCKHTHTHAHNKFHEKNFRKKQLPNWPKKLQLASYLEIHPCVNICCSRLDAALLLQKSSKDNLDLQKCSRSYYKNVCSFFISNSCYCVLSVFHYIFPNLYPTPTFLFHFSDLKKFSLIYFLILRYFFWLKYFSSGFFSSLSFSSYPDHPDFNNNFFRF